MLQGDLDVLLNRAEFIIFMQSRVTLGPGNFHVVVLVITIFTMPIIYTKYLEFHLINNYILRIFISDEIRKSNCVVYRTFASQI